MIPLHVHRCLYIRTHITIIKTRKQSFKSRGGAKQHSQHHTHTRTHTKHPQRKQKQKMYVASDEWKCVLYIQAQLQAKQTTQQTKANYHFKKTKQKPAFMNRSEYHEGRSPLRQTSRHHWTKKTRHT